MGFMFKKIRPFWVVCAFCALVLSGCGETSNSSNQTLGDLPDANSPVVDESASRSLPAFTDVIRMALNSIIGEAHAEDLIGMATTGVNFYGLSSSTFEIGDSPALCGMSFRFRQVLSSAGEGGLIQCYVKEGFANNQDLGVDIYDGSYHIFALNITGEEEGGGPSKIKMKVARNDSGQITSLEMFACSGTGDSMTQMMYLNQTISNGSFSMTNVGTFAEPGGGTFAQSTAVSATVNSSLQFTSSKTITGSMDRSGGSNGESHGSFEATQTSSTITYNGSECGTWSNGEESGTFSNEVVSMAQLVDPNTSTGSDYNIQLLAAGDGCAKVNFEGDSFTDTQQSECWNADTKAVVNQSDDLVADYVSILNETPDACPASVTISFSESQTWDCSGTSEGTVDMDMTAINTACSSKDLGHGDYFECHTLVVED